MLKGFKNFALKKFCLIICLLFAAFLRIIYLDKVPAGLLIDEGLIVYNAISLAQTGADVFGFQFPVHLLGFGWGENAVLVYLLAFVIWLTGSTNIIIFKLTIIIFQLLIILFTYLLTEQLFGYETAIISAFLLTLSPWNLTLSRLIFNVSLWPFFHLAGLYFLLKGLNNKKNYLFFGSALTLSLSFYTYALSFVWLPLIFLIIYFVYQNKLKNITKKNYLVFFLTLFVLSLPIFLFYLKNYLDIFNHWDKIFIFSLPQLSSTRFETISIFNFPAYLIPLIFLKNYWLQFSPIFLFFNATLSSFPQYFGLLYLWEAPLLILGLILGLKNFQSKNYQFILYWLFFSPLASSLTIEAIPHPLRFINALPVLEILCALGLLYLWENYQAKYKKYILIFLFLAFLNLAVFFSYYFLIYPKATSEVFLAKDKEVTAFIQKNYDYYDNFYIVNVAKKNSLSIYNYLIYSQYSPQILQQKKPALLGPTIQIDKLNFINLERFEQLQDFAFAKKSLILLPAVYQEDDFLSDKIRVQEFNNLNNQAEVIAFKTKEELIQD